MPTKRAAVSLSKILQAIKARLIVLFQTMRPVSREELLLSMKNLCMKIK
jgi:hypothetical protein